MILEIGALRQGKHLFKGATMRNIVAHCCARTTVANKGHCSCSLGPRVRTLKQSRVSPADSIFATVWAVQLIVFHGMDLFAVALIIVGTFLVTAIAALIVYIIKAVRKYLRTKIDSPAKKKLSKKRTVMQTEETEVSFDSKLLSKLVLRMWIVRNGLVFLMYCLRTKP